MLAMCVRLGQPLSPQLTFMHTSMYVWPYSRSLILTFTTRRMHNTRTAAFCSCIIYGARLVQCSVRTSILAPNLDSTLAPNVKNNETIIFKINKKKKTI